MRLPVANETCFRDKERLAFQEKCCWCVFVMFEGDEAGKVEVMAFSLLTHSRCRSSSLFFTRNDENGKILVKWFLKFVQIFYHEVCE